MWASLQGDPKGPCAHHPQCRGAGERENTCKVLPPAAGISGALVQMWCLMEAVESKPPSWRVDTISFLTKLLERIQQQLRLLCLPV